VPTRRPHVSIVLYVLKGHRQPGHHGLQRPNREFPPQHKIKPSAAELPQKGACWVRRAAAGRWELSLTRSPSTKPLRIFPNVSRKAGRCGAIATASSGFPFTVVTPFGSAEIRHRHLLRQYAWRPNLGLDTDAENPRAGTAGGNFSQMLSSRNSNNFAAGGGQQSEALSGSFSRCLWPPGRQHRGRGTGNLGRNSFPKRRPNSNLDLLTGKRHQARRAFA